MTRLSRKVDDRPAFQFYVKDWLTSLELMGCSLAAKGLWIDALCYMWLSPERGVLEAKALQKLCKSPAKLVQKLCKELASNGVCEIIKRGDNLLIISRKMHREWEAESNISKVRREAALAKALQKPCKSSAKEKQKGGSSTASSTSIASSTALKRVSSNEDTLVSAGAPTIATISKDVVVLWNSFAKDQGLSVVKDLTEDRKRKLKVRLYDKDFVDNFSAALPKIAASDFLRGLSKASSWRASFDWLIANSTNVIKILEGKYDNIKPKDRSHDVAAAISDTINKAQAMGIE